MELAISHLETASPSLQPLLAALAAHRMGDEKAWKDAMSKINEPEKLPPGMRAVLAGFFAMQGEMIQSRRLLETLSGSMLDGRLIGDKRGLLLPEELRLMQSTPR